MKLDTRSPLWPEFSRLLDRALEVPEEERPQWLQHITPADVAILPWLQHVLLHPDGRLPDDFLDAPQITLPAADSEFTAGQQVGPWMLVEELGRGGMGSVWRARRIDGELTREAALKLPHSHLLAGSLRERFARERDILAGLEHPHIATLYDARVADSGQPWLALELVQGANILDWCRDQDLGLEARLTLFGQVLKAVQYAHSRLVIHRDLKPSNVWVNDSGQVKLLDFGVAKLLSDNDTGSHTLTLAHGRIATPDYAAPEQLAGSVVTTATDVYSLGVMLYELLCGQRPFAHRGHAGLGQVSANAGDAPLASSRAGTASLRNALRGDLDAILAKTLSAVPEQRYGTVDALAADLARAGRHEPIEARHIGTLQLLGKLLRRHRLGASFAAVLLIVLTAGISGVLWQAREAKQQARRAEAVKEFLIGVFEASDPRIASDTPRGQITARQLLDLSVPRIEARFADDPEVQIELLRTAADIYRELGEIAAADTLQERQLALVRRHYGPLHPNVLDHAVNVAQVACGAGDTARCVSAQREADALLRQADDTDPERRGLWWISEGLRLRSDSGQANATQAALSAQDAFEHATALFAREAPRSRGHVTALLELASALQIRQEMSRSIVVHRQAIALAQSLDHPNDVELQTLWGNLGLVYQQIGRFTEAGDAYRHAAAYAERTTGADFHTAWAIRGNAARTLHLAGERDASHREYDRILPLLPTGETTDGDVAMLRMNYGERLTSEGRAMQALALLEAAERTFHNQAPYEFQLRLTRRFLGEAYLRAGRKTEARAMLRSALDDYLRHDTSNSQPVMAARESWGRLLLQDGHTIEARTEFAAIISAAEGRKFSHVALAHGGLARVALAANDQPLALAESAQALALWAKVEGFHDVRMGPYLQRIRADVLAASGDITTAQLLEDDAVTASARYDHPSSPTAQRRAMARH
jgi:eukaryotic-like serine/threonine-protein kinase